MAWLERGDKAMEEREKKINKMKFKGKSIFEDIWREIHVLEKVLSDKGLKEIKIILNKKDLDNWSNSKLSEKKIKKIHKKIIKKMEVKENVG